MVRLQSILQLNQILTDHGVSSLTSNSTDTSGLEQTERLTIAITIQECAIHRIETDLTPTLEWDAATGAVTYTLEWADNASFTGSTVVTGIAGTQYTMPQALADGTYYWRVKTVGASTESAYSGTDSFVIIPTMEGWIAALLALAMAGYAVCRRRRQLTAHS